VRRAHAERAEGAKRYGYTAAHRREDLSPYSTNLTDAEWELVADLFERIPGQRGTPVHYSRRDLVNACSYVLRTGCAWQLLPETFPPWQAVYKAFSRWVCAGVFEQMQDRLREQWRARMGRASTPSAAVIDAQSTRASPQGGESGFDAGKKVKGRKRNLVVDTMGLLIAVTVTAASVEDRDAAAAVVAQACVKSPRLEKLYTDGAYGGKCAHDIEKAHHIRVEVVRRPPLKRRFLQSTMHFSGPLPVRVKNWLARAYSRRSKAMQAIPRIPVRRRCGNPWPVSSRQA